MREHDSSYLLRVWSDGEGRDAWRASVHDLRSRETAYFASLHHLMAFIRTIGPEREEGADADGP